MEVCFWLVPFHDGCHSNDKLGRGAGNNLGLLQVSLPLFLASSLEHATEQIVVHICMGSQ